jgi:hypothetical protein
MSVDVEYAIKKDIRNNPVIREVDTRQTREFRRIVALACLAVGMLLFSAWQHFQMRAAGYQIERLRLDRAAEETTNRQLRLNVETLRAPRDIERRARAMGLVQPTLEDTVVVERTPAPQTPQGVVALAR